MRPRTAAIGLALAIFGLGAAVGIGFAANSISGDTVGLSAAPLSAGDGLAPAASRDDSADAARERRAARRAERRRKAARRAAARREAQRTTSTPPLRPRRPRPRRSPATSRLRGPRSGRLGRRRQLGFQTSRARRAAPTTAGPEDDNSGHGCCHDASALVTACADRVRHHSSTCPSRATNRTRTGSRGPGGLRGDVHQRDRHDDRQRRAAGHLGGPERGGRRAPVGVRRFLVALAGLLLVAAGSPTASGESGSSCRHGGLRRGSCLARSRRTRSR